MQQTFKPTPTEYRGVRFRSKSEAIFAALLDTAGFEDWLYEPHFLEVSGYTPDFCVPLVSDHNDLALVIIEYKPAATTATYRNLLTEHCIEMRRKVGLECDYFIVNGSMFEGLPDVLYLEDGKWFQIGSLQEAPLFGVRHWFGADALNVARSKRFDLEMK